MTELYYSYVIPSVAELTYWAQSRDASAIMTPNPIVTLAQIWFNQPKPNSIIIDY